MPNIKHMIADELIALSAFRYALGRRSYIVSHVARWLIANKDALGKHGAGIVRDIDEAEGRGGGALGMDMDREEWLAVRAAFAERSPHHAGQDDERGGRDG